MPTLSPSPSPAEPVVRLRTPPEIVRAVPQLLGFHPAASIVVLGLAGARLRLRMTMRVDLPAQESAEELAEYIAVRLAAERLTAATVIVFTKPAGPPPSEASRPPEEVPDASTETDTLESGPRGGAGAPRKGSPNRNGRPRRGGPVRKIPPRPRPSRVRAALPGAVAAFAVDDALRRAGIDVREVLRAEDGRWWSYVCELTCCPPEGLPLGGEPTTLLEVMRVAAGRPIFPDRAALVASVARTEGEPTPALRAAIRDRLAVVGIRRLAGIEADDDLTALQALLARDAGLVGAPGLLPDVPLPAAPQSSALRPEAASRDNPAPVPSTSADEAAALADVLEPTVAEPNPAGHGDDVLAFVAVALTNLPVRDASFAWTGGPLAGAAIGLWRELVQRVPAPYAAAPATLLAVAAYRRGDGSLADAYLRRALEDDPDYRMADLVLSSLEQGLHPADVTSALGLKAVGTDAGPVGTDAGPVGTDADPVPPDPGTPAPGGGRAPASGPASRGASATAKGSARSGGAGGQRASRGGRPPGSSRANDPDAR